jgi:N-6 DNA Methylase
LIAEDFPCAAQAAFTAKDRLHFEIGCIDAEVFDEVTRNEAKPLLLLGRKGVEGAQLCEAGLHPLFSRQQGRRGVCALHTVLRLPRGTFTPYSQGVKANVIFFQKGRPTEHVWIFDARSNVPGITKKDRPLTAQHFAEFEQCYGADPNGLGKRRDLGVTGRFRRFTRNEIEARGYKLDITWLKDESLEDSDELPEPQDLAAEAITELEAVVDDLREIVALVEKEEEAVEN